MKITVVVLLVIIGLYWLFGHTAPIPFNHEQFGLYNHTAHCIIGVVFLLAAGFVWWNKKT